VRWPVARAEGYGVRACLRVGERSERRRGTCFHGVGSATGYGCLGIVAGPRLRESATGLAWTVRLALDARLALIVFCSP
jgi:hypothetical protein